MNTTINFHIHDTQSFPLVWSRAGAIKPGYAAQWIGEMDALLVRAQPFVIAFEEGQPEETQEDRKSRGLWLKQNKSLLGTFCKAVIAIEPDALKRSALEAQTALASRAFGVAMEVLASRESVAIRARALLMEDR